ncbi:TRAP transporter substrate-binding protein [Paenibacillus sp. J5C_2022]|uniref:TRAP transporter substrate-binding protein n=1 Tax=Paenibacillus sp. J5C2022 TaxID=2977129 RepID=UPI0021D02B9C|nr:TRAP transporter substrate-binding protein [Paenibacillus sp. J5C2022]MCU6710580.1 TRAP transporter substrate-binding protein [Paenibacillus sp. J5C2022]
MKKLMAGIVACAMVFTLAACGSSNGNSGSGSEAGAGNNKADGDKKVYTIKLGHSDKSGDSSIIDWTARQFADLASQYSDGQLKVEIYPSNQLGDQLEQMRSVQNGTQEMVQGSVNNFGTFAPSVNYLTLPYIFKGSEQARDAIDKLWDKNNEFGVEQAGMRFLLWTDAGFRAITSDKNHPVRSLADLKGLKMKVPPNKIFESAFQAFGSDTVVLPFSEAFTAMQQGLVHAQENAYTTARTEHYYEVHKYITDIEWMYTISSFAISETYFQSLPKELQDALVKAGKEASQLERDRFDQLMEDDIKFLEEKGMERLGKPEDIDQWIELGRSVWPQAYESIGGGSAAKGEEIVNEVLSIIE